MGCHFKSGEGQLEWSVEGDVPNLTHWPVRKVLSGVRHLDTCKPGSLLPSLLAVGPAGPEPLPGNCFP